MRTVLLSFQGLCLLGCLSSLAATPEAEILLAKVREAKRTVGGYTLPDVHAAKRHLDYARAAAERLISAQKYAAEWRAFLDWPGMQKALDASEFDDSKIKQQLAPFYSNQPGVEFKEILAFREAVEKYRIAQDYAHTANAKARVEKQLDKLAEALEQMDIEGSADKAHALGVAVGDVEKSGIAPTLVDAVHHQYSKPNFHFQVSKRFIEEDFRKQLKESAPIRDVIQGARVFGDSTFTGESRLEFVPSESRAILQIRVLGTIHGVSTGQKKKVTTYNTSVTSVDLRKQFAITASGIEPQPAKAYCQTSSTYNRVDANYRLGIVRRIAVNKAYEAKPAGEIEAAQHAAIQLQQKADQANPEGFDQLTSFFYDGLYYPQQRLGILPREFRWRTTEDKLEQRIVRRNISQVAAPNAAEPIDTKHDATLLFHESEVANLIAGYIAEKEVTDEDLATTIKMYLGKVPQELRLGSHMPRWSMWMHGTQPMTMDFRTGLVGITFRTTAVTIGEKTYPATAKVSTVYKIKITEFGPELERAGDVKVTSYSDTALPKEVKEHLFVKFDDIFQKELNPDGLTPPQGGLFDKLIGLGLKEFRSEKGWLRLGWQMLEKPAK